MSLTRSVEIDLRHVKFRKRRFEEIIYYNDQLYLFSSFFPDKEQKKNRLYVQKIDKKTLTPTQKLREIASIDYEGHTRYNSRKA